MRCLLIQEAINSTAMKPTKDRVFLDTNILIYSYSHTEPQKQVIAANIISQNNSVVSTQVLNELVNIVTRKFNFSYLQAAEAVSESCRNNHLHINTQATILLACEIAAQNNFSFFDSVIIAAALESGCTILYTEDMHPIKQIGGQLAIVNPFK
jgi:predicted nucleic acid-binding protein